MNDEPIPVSSNERCAVQGCENTRSQGRFVGDFCAACDSALRSGNFEFGTGVPFRLKRERDEAITAGRTYLELLNIRSNDRDRLRAELNELQDEAQAVMHAEHGSDWADHFAPLFNLIQRAKALVSGEPSAHETYGGWRPMETAPRDGTSVLLCWPYWAGTTPCIGEFDGSDWNSQVVLSDAGVGPLWWQPLPKVPQPSSEKASDRRDPNGPSCATLECQGHAVAGEDFCHECLNTENGDSQ